MKDKDRNNLLILGGAGVLAFYAMTKIGQNALIEGGRKTGEETAAGFSDALKKALDSIVPKAPNLPPVASTSPVISAGMDLAGIAKLISLGKISAPDAANQYSNIMWADRYASPTERAIYSQLTKWGTSLRASDRANLSRMGINATGGYTPQTQLSLAAYPAWTAARDAQRAATPLIQDLQKTVAAATTSPTAQNSFKSAALTGALAGFSPALASAPTAFKSTETVFNSTVEYLTPMWNNLEGMLRNILFGNQRPTWKQQVIRGVLNGP